MSVTAGVLIVGVIAGWIIRGWVTGWLMNHAISKSTHSAMNRDIEQWAYRLFHRKPA